MYWSLFFSPKSGEPYYKVSTPEPVAEHAPVPPIQSTPAPKKRVVPVYVPPPDHIDAVLVEKAAVYGVDVALARKVAFCESRWAVHAHNTKNRDGSNDGGLMQINSVHLPELHARGLDRFDLEDGVEFAMILMARNGTRDYKASEWCWAHI